jgi:hypothetical protein
VTAIAATWLAVWRDAHGDTTRMRKPRQVTPREAAPSPTLPALTPPAENPPPQSAGRQLPGPRPHPSEEP